MGVLSSAFRAAVTGTRGIATPERWVEDWVRGGIETAAGVRVDAETAYEYSAFWAGVRVISEDVATLPLITYQRLDRGKRRAAEHPLYPVLHDAANPMMTAAQFRQTLQGHALTWGNGYAQIVRDNGGRMRELWPLRPDRTTPEIHRRGAGALEVWYRYTDGTNGIYELIAPENVLHIAGLGFDGICGYSVIHYARNSLALGLATERYGASFFGNGSRPGGVLSHPGVLSPEAKKRIATDWDNSHRGLDRAQRVTVLEEGVSWQQIGIPPEDAQFLQTRQLQVTEMARWLRLPPHKIADLERATFSNIEHLQLDYVSSALRIWLVTWEQTIALRLLTETERSTYYAEHLVDALLRGDTMSRYQAYAIGRQWGWFSANDVREKENENPVEGGDTYLVPLNMVPADQLALDPPPPPAAGDQDDDGDGEELGAAAAAAHRRRSVAARRRLARSFLPLFVDADRRLATMERAEVGSLVRRYLQQRGPAGRSTSAFLAAVEDLYQGLVRERTLARWLPLLVVLGGEIAADAAEDVGADDPPDLTTWITAYAASHVAYRVASAIGQLRAVVEDPETEDPAAAVAGRLDKWVDERPERTARWESVQLPNAAARETWRTAGVRKVRWRIRGDTCPFCTKLDGVVVAIEEPFAPAGGQVTGLESKLEIERNTFHPPLHPGCDCAIEPA